MEINNIDKNYIEFIDTLYTKIEKFSLFDV